MLRTMGRRQGKGEVERGEEEFIQFLPTVNKRSYPLSHLPSIFFFFKIWIWPFNAISYVICLQQYFGEIGNRGKKSRHDTLIILLC